MTADVETRALSVRYGRTTAVDDLSLHLAGPAIHGLLGRNGSGKTSLLSAVAGFRRPSAGEVLIDGEPVFENPTATRKVCFIRGAGDSVEHDWPGDRVHHALQLAARLRPRWDAEYADKLVDRFALATTKRLGELSRGQRSALGVILGLASRAPLTIFDESYLGMDAPSRYAFYEELLSDFLAHPRTIVVSTHLIEEVASLFEQVAIIDAGRLLLHEPAEELRARGATIIGPVEPVDRFTAGMTPLTTRELGPTRAVTVDGVLDEADRRRAAELGLKLGPVALQDLFVHLTEPGDRS